MLLKEYYDRVNIMGQASYILSAPVEAYAQEPQEIRDYNNELLTEAKRLYPKEYAELTCYGHKLAARSFWMGCYSSMGAIMTTGGIEDGVIEDDQFQIEHLMIMADIILSDMHTEAEAFAASGQEAPQHKPH